MKLSTSRRIIPLFNAFQFFFALLWWVPIFYEYQKRLGLSDAEIFRIQSWYYLIFCLLEIPTGLLADYLGYRFCMILGGLTLILANGMVPFAGTYDGFLIHWTLIALARSFVSGASSAYLYQSFTTAGTLSAYKEAEGKARAYSLVGKIVCWFFVGPLMNLHFTLPYWLTTLNAVLSVVFAVLLPHLDTVKTKTRVNPIDLLRTLAESPYLILIMLQGVSIFVLTRICQVNLFQPILKSKAFSATTFGMVMAGMTLFEALGSFRSEWLKKYLNDRNAVTILTCIIALSFLILSLPGTQAIHQGVALGAFFLFSYAVGISFPIQRKLMNDAIKHPEYRASLLSIESIIDRAVNSLVAFGLGSALTHGHLSEFLVYSGLVAVIGAALIAYGLRVVRRANRLENL
jgi:MFS family permease